VQEVRNNGPVEPHRADNDCRGRDGRSGVIQKNGLGDF
jgi:hypothetical protein